MSRIAAIADTTFSVIRNANTQDGGGALIPQETIYSAGNLGKLDALTGNKVITDGKGTLLANYILFCDSLSVVPSDRIKITASIGTLITNKTLDIYMIDDTTLRGRNPHLEIYLKYAE